MITFQGRSAVSLAIEYGHEEAANLLLQKPEVRDEYDLNVWTRWICLIHRVYSFQHRQLHSTRLAGL